jgi:hypothetical protein
MDSGASPRLMMPVLALAGQRMKPKSAHESHPDDPHMDRPSRALSCGLPCDDGPPGFARVPARDPWARPPSQPALTAQREAASPPRLNFLRLARLKFLRLEEDLEGQRWASIASCGPRRLAGTPQATECRTALPQASKARWAARASEAAAAHE